MQALLYALKVLYFFILTIISPIILVRLIQYLPTQYADALFVRDETVWFFTLVLLTCVCVYTMTMSIHAIVQIFTDVIHIKIKK